MVFILFTWLLWLPCIFAADTLPPLSNRPLDEYILSYLRLSYLLAAKRQKANLRTTEPNAVVISPLPPRNDERAAHEICLLA
ncbi:hypothetical protein K450DRAFT_221893 [Umbelopsis ramanniana AG]|uniref:Secreted protein n=1 Tax=Umbelopsis ramanniana AG TaxID=1314678 RepID=A0AAD5EI10_UMBRA|nr:uncharacterized protein K450DRAFT_221893 [Umbelopsis ramanniana AG]KAI8583594.1 hypothetical protein K450DRAFT_221893 [Umbelopsis ramanniana AG]